MKFWNFGAALALVVAIQGAEAQQPSALPAQPVRNVTLEDLDKGLAAFKSMLWTLPSRAGIVKPDHTGATLEGDLGKHVLNDATLARIETLYTQASASIPAGSKFIPAENLAPLDELMTAESCRILVVSGYWQARSTAAYHEDMTRKLIERLPAPMRSAAAARLTALGARINDLRSTMATDVGRCSRNFMPDSGTLTEILIDYNKDRQDLAASLRRNQPSNGDSLRKKRSTACPAPVAASDGGDSPLRLISRKSPEDFYPPASVAREVEGRVNVALTYDSTGCVVETEIFESSGADELDNAALEFGFGTVLQAPVVNGKPVEGKVLSAVVFKMMAQPAESAPRPQLQP